MITNPISLVSKGDWDNTVCALSHLLRLLQPCGGEDDRSTSLIINGGDQRVKSMKSQLGNLHASIHTVQRTFLFYHFNSHADRYTSDLSCKEDAKGMRTKIHPASFDMLLFLEPCIVPPFE